MKNTVPKSEKPLQLDMPFGEALQRYLNVNTKDVVTIVEEGDPEDQAAPFIKWVGGKRSIISEILPRVPAKIKNYFEPFMGGSALFYELADKIEHAYLSDINLDLVITYSVVKKDVHKLIELLKVHQKKHSEEYYYKIRSQHSLKDPIEVAARFIYLNKTCFNGLYRVNKSGEFNVPIGSYTNPDICSEKRLLLCHKAFKKATINYKDFTDIKPVAGDFVYFDPPYHPTSDTSFTDYAKDGFTEKDQSRLRDFALELHRAGVKVMLSNSNTDYIRDLYKSKAFKIGIVHAPRNVNCKPGKRGAVEEVLITNY